MTTHDQHLLAIRAQLTTAEELAFFDSTIAKMRSQGPVGVQRLEAIAALSVDDAVTMLRRELPRPLVTRASGFVCDSEDSLCDTDGHEIGVTYDNPDSRYDATKYRE